MSFPCPTTRSPAPVPLETYSTYYLGLPCWCRNNLLRVTAEEEAMGLDHAKHGGSAYNYNMEDLVAMKDVASYKSNGAGQNGAEAV